MTYEYDKNWAYARLPLPTNKPTIDILMDNDDKMLELVLQLTNTYLDLQVQVNQQKQLISLQGNLINQCMERIMSLEGRGVLGNFNQRLEELEQHIKEMEKLLISTSNKVEQAENWLYTHDYQYFQEEEAKQQGIADNAQLDETGTHPPDCSCSWCMPQEGDMVI